MDEILIDWSTLQVGTQNNKIIIETDVSLSTAAQDAFNTLVASGVTVGNLAVVMSVDNGKLTIKLPIIEPQNNNQVRAIRKKVTDLIKQSHQEVASSEKYAQQWSRALASDKKAD